MSNKIVIGIIVVMAVIMAVFIGSDLLRTQPNRELTGIDTTKEPSTSPNSNCVPTFADGGGPYYQANSPFRSKIVPYVNNGEKLIVRGKVVQNDCKTAVPGAVVDIWQANETGDYQDGWYRGQVTANSNGEYMFETVIPKGYGEGTAFRPPHIHFKIFRDGSEIITSQMFFPDVEGTPGFDDAYIMKLEERTAGNERIFEGYHDIVLP